MKPKEYDYIRLCLGYPDHEDTSRIIWRKWNGFKMGKFETELFGKIHCFAIDVSEKIYSNQFLTPAGNKLRKRTLTLNLKRKYWEEIRDDKKHFEFRENKPFWRKRFLTQ